MINLFRLQFKSMKTKESTQITGCYNKQYREIIDHVVVL